MIAHYIGLFSEQEYQVIVEKEENARVIAHYIGLFSEQVTVEGVVKYGRYM